MEQLILVGKQAMCNRAHMREADMRAAKLEAELNLQRQLEHECNEALSKANAELERLRRSLAIAHQSLERTDFALASAKAVALNCACKHSSTDAGSDVDVTGSSAGSSNLE